MILYTRFPQPHKFFTHKTKYLPPQLWGKNWAILTKKMIGLLHTSAEFYWLKGYAHLQSKTLSSGMPRLHSNGLVSVNAAHPCSLSCFSRSCWWASFACIVCTSYVNKFEENPNPLSTVLSASCSRLFGLIKKCSWAILVATFNLWGKEFTTVEYL